VPGLVLYRPPSLVLGLGCNRGTPAAEILAAIDDTLAGAGLAPGSVGRVATIEDKLNEAGLRAACQARGWPLQAFSRAEIATVTDLPNPSPWAERELGVRGVAEPAAWLAAHPGRAPSGPPRLLVEKQKFPNVTVAVARFQDEGESRYNA
jgi:cobalamin biosynthesis protein CbiG